MDNKSKNLDEINTTLTETNDKMQKLINTQKRTSFYYVLGFWLSIFFNLISLLVFAIITACNKKITTEKRDTFLYGWLEGFATLLSTLVLMAVFCFVAITVFKFMLEHPEKF